MWQNSRYSKIVEFRQLCGDLSDFAKRNWIYILYTSTDMIGNKLNTAKSLDLWQWLQESSRFTQSYSNICIQHISEWLEFSECSLNSMELHCPPDREQGDPHSHCTVLHWDPAACTAACRSCTIRLSSLAKFQDNLEIQRKSWNSKIFYIISCTFIVTDCCISCVLTPMLQRLNSCWNHLAVEHITLVTETGLSLLDILDVNH